MDTGPNHDKGNQIMAGFSVLADLSKKRNGSDAPTFGSRGGTSFICLFPSRNYFYLFDCYLFDVTKKLQSRTIG
jgi:hypothetical protein